MMYTYDVFYMMENINSDDNQKIYDERNKKMFNSVTLPIMLSCIGNTKDIMSFALVSKLFRDAYILMKRKNVYDSELHRRWLHNKSVESINIVFKCEIYCVTDSMWYTIISKSDTKPHICPNNARHSVLKGSAFIVEKIIIDF